MTGPPTSIRIDPLAVRAALAAAGLRARHSLSQNFLADIDTLEAILAEAAPRPGERILEIGPGLGIVTGALLAAGATVTAVEVDRGLAQRLRGRFAAEIESDALRLIESDILDLDLGEVVASPFDVVANLPYHITSPILHQLLGTSLRPHRAVLMVQREVAERIAARPGGLSYLSAFVQYHAAVQIVRIVPREAFEPAPKVESAIVALEPFPADAPHRLGEVQEDELWRLVMAAFRERRKMLRNVLPRQLGLDAQRVEAALEGLGIDPNRRPQTLSVAEWLAIRSVLSPLPPDRRGRRTAEP